jgi:hypothetical protein
MSTSGDVFKNHFRIYKPDSESGDIGAAPISGGGEYLRFGFNWEEEEEDLNT